MLPELCWPWTLGVTWRRERPPLWPEQWSVWARCERDFLQTTWASLCGGQEVILSSRSRLHLHVCLIFADRSGAARLLSKDTALWECFGRTFLCWCQMTEQKSVSTVKWKSTFGAVNHKYHLKVHLVAILELLITYKSLLAVFFLSCRVLDV